MPTLKQKNLMLKIAEDKGKRPLKDLMVESGYSPKTAWGSQQRTLHGAGFVELLNKMGATDQRIAKVLKAGLDAKVGKKTDFLTRHRYVETIMKAKGLLKEQDSEFGSLANFIENMKGFDFEVLIAIKQRLIPKVEENATVNNGQ